MRLEQHPERNPGRYGFQPTAHRARDIGRSHHVQARIRRKIPDKLANVALPHVERHKRIRDPEKILATFQPLADMEDRSVANEFQPEGRTQRREPLQQPDAIEVERDARLRTDVHKHGHPVGKRNRAGDILQARIHEIERNLVGHVALSAPRAPQAKK